MEDSKKVQENTQQERRNDNKMPVDIIERMTDAFYALDNEWRFTYVNAAAEKNLCIKREEILGKVIWEVFPKTIDSKLDKQYHLAMSNQIPACFETIAPTFKFRVEVRAYPSPEGLSVFFKDITEQKQAEEILMKAHELERLVSERTGELQRSNEKLRNEIEEHQRTEEALKKSREDYKYIIQYAPSAIYELDFVTQRFTSVNDVMCAVSGYSEAELLSMDPFSIFDQESKRKLQKRIDKILSGEVGESVECKAITKDGREYWVDLSIKVIYKDEKTVRGLGIGHDVTGRKQAEDALRKADQQKDEFLAMLSHELRNPLAAIRNSLSILDRATPEGIQAKRAKDVINRQAEQLSRLVDDLLDINRINKNKINLQQQQLELNELVRRSVEDHRSLFEKNGICLELETSPDTIFVNGDKARLTQVVENLLTNAAKFTNRGESTRISIERDTSKQQAIIRVIDTGIGIAPEMMPHLFKLFFQANTSLDRSEGGLGLGLPLSKGLIELHGGEISVNSAGLGKGSEFIVRLPLDDAKAEELQASYQEVSHCTRRVLIIDDNLDLARSLFELLALSNHEVVVTYDGYEGLEKAREFKPEVVLCDIGLPGMDGYKVAQAFREDKALKDVFLVALTGYAQSADKLKAVKAGFEAHLAKPVDLNTLERLLAELPDTV